MVKLLDGFGIQNVVISFNDEDAMDAFCKPWVKSIEEKEAKEALEKW
jgi:hypothetical protein